MSQVNKSRLESKYSNLVALYRGHGKHNGDETSFDVGQRQDGSIVLCCGLRLMWRDNCDLDGITDAGLNIKAQGSVKTAMGAYSDVAYNREFSDYFYASDYIFRISVGEHDWSRAETIIFDITNLVFVGNSGNESMWSVDRNSLELTIAGVGLTLTRLDNYVDIVDSLNDEHGTQTTCELRINVKHHSEQEILNVVNGVCSLLSIARGIQVNWIKCRYLDSESVDFFTHHRSQITSTFQDYELIYSGHEDATETFLTKSYPVYRKLNSHYNFGSLAHILVDIQSSGFLETRCLLLYVTIELLCRKVDNSDITLKERVRKYIDQHQVPVLKCVNQKCGSTGSPCEPNCDIGYFVKCRNSLVHKMKFSSTDSSREYVRNLGLLHKMLLRAFGYEYIFIDRVLGQFGKEDAGTFLTPRP